MINANRLLRAAILLMSLVPFLAGCFVIRVLTWRTPGEHRKAAEKLRADGSYAEAIEQYLLHIDERLADSGRPEEENPYFYYIFIGDIYLDQGDAPKALGSYGSAMQMGVQMEFIIDRYRRVAHFYEEQAQIQQAIDFLSKYREMDELLFDAEIDRLHKRLVTEEIERLHNPG